MKRLVRKFFYRLIARFAPVLIDQRTGRPLGRGLAIGVGSSVNLVGYHKPYVRAVFRGERGIFSTINRIGFATHAPVDFPRVIASGNSQSDTSNRKVLWALLSHADRERCLILVNYWLRLGYHADDMLVVYGGSQDEFNRLDLPVKAVFVPDASLRTEDHQLGKQSYRGPMREAAHFVRDKPHQLIALVEQDHVPVVPDWGDRLAASMDAQAADVLVNELDRVDGTNNPHYKYHLADPAFASAWESFSVREDRGTILNGLCAGVIWRRDALCATVACELPTAVYLEFDIPTTAHHLGFRVRSCPAQDAFAGFGEIDDIATLDGIRARGGWSAHKVKDLTILAG